ncbi:MAG: trimethylamine methyltransferase family protein, partial [Actinobacteria bacterium]|nr:trimethylamine methyltransferase family protein [Actinomycetota bacterium]
ENLDFVKIICGCIYPNDIDPKYRDLFVLKTLLQYSTKYIYMQPYNSENLKAMVDMISVLKEDITGLEDLALMNVSISSTSPLKFDSLDIDLLYKCCENNIPVLMCVGPISGLTAPVTIAGGLVVQHAESMAGFIFAQVIKKGSPIVYEPRLTGADMRTANISHASIEFLLTTIASTKLAGLLKIPLDAGNMICDSKVPDMQAGIEKSTGLFMAGQFNPSMISGVGNLEAANSFSLEEAVIDNELLRMFARFKKGFEVNDETLAIDAIHEIGYSSNYVIHEHTLKNYKNEQYIFDIIDRDFGQAWVDKGSKGIVDNANDKVTKILKNNSEPKLDNRLIRKIEKIYRKHIKKF